MKDCIDAALASSEGGSMHTMDSIRVREREGQRYACIISGLKRLKSDFKDHLMYCATFCCGGSRA